MINGLKLSRAVGIIGNIIILIAVVFMVLIFGQPGENINSSNLYGSIISLPPLISIFCYILIIRIRHIALVLIWTSAILWTLLSYLGIMSFGMYFAPLTILPVLGVIGVTATSRATRSKLAGIVGSLLGIFTVVGVSILLSMLFILLSRANKLAQINQPFPPKLAILIIEGVVAIAVTMQLFAIIGHLFIKRFRRLSLMFIWLGAGFLISLFVFLLVVLLLGIKTPFRSTYMGFLMTFYFLLPAIVSLFGAIGVTRVETKG